MTRICLKRDTDENFKKKNEILMEGEIAFIKDDYNNIKSMKVGNGTDSYTDLETFASRDEIQELKRKIIELKVSIDDYNNIKSMKVGNGTDSYTDLETFASRDEIQELKRKIIELKVSINVILGLIALGAGYFAFLTITIFN